MLRRSNSFLSSSIFTPTGPRFFTSSRAAARRGRLPLDIHSRADLKNAQRIVIKAGTTTTTDSTGLPSLRRVTSLVEQMSVLRRQGKDVCFVASGAVGYGRAVQRRQRILLSSALDRMYDVDHGGDGNSYLSRNANNNTLAAMGQSSMMSLYQQLFAQVDTAVAQLLLTPHDFEQPQQVQSTLEGFFANGVVPVCNENDAVTSAIRRGTAFTDNDGLATLVAELCNADLVLYLTDVDGLYDRDPSDPAARFVSVWPPSGSNVKFGEKSSMGRGGMEAKAASALKALKAGIPASAIISGHRHGTILNVCNGDQEGTLFVHHPEKLTNQTAVEAGKLIEAQQGRNTKEAAPSSAAAADASSPAAAAEIDVADEAAVAQAKAARDGGLALASELTSSQRSHLLNEVADALSEKMSMVLAANAEDIEREKNTLAAPLLARLALSEAKMQTLIKAMRALAASPEPIGKVVSKTLIADGAVLRKETTPIGVLLIVFESRPDALVQIAGLTLRTGNGLLLKGGKEAARTNSALHRIITDAVHSASGGKVPRGVIGLVESRSDVSKLLSLDKYIDLVIPRGSNSLVRSVQSKTKIPVLGHADGICHIYLDRTCNLDAAVNIIVDAKLQYPAACNAVETLLIDSGIHAAKIGLLLQKLSAAGVELRAGPVAQEAFKAELPVAADPATLYAVEYGDARLTVELVDNCDAAISHINHHGSHHTDAILSESEDVCKHFTSMIDSAAVFTNASTRMCDGLRFGLMAEIGISTSRISHRGPVGIDGLLTHKWVLESSSATNEVTATAFAEGKKEFIHKKLPVNEDN